MKKYLCILAAAFLMSAVLPGCRRSSEMMPETTGMPTVTSPSVIWESTAPSEETFPPVHTISPEEEAMIDATIEDGNGPIPSQKPAAK